MPAAKVRHRSGRTRLQKKTIIRLVSQTLRVLSRMPAGAFVPQKPTPNFCVLNIQDFRKRQQRLKQLQKTLTNLPNTRFTPPPIPIPTPGTKSLNRTSSKFTITLAVKSSRSVLEPSHLRWLCILWRLGHTMSTRDAS